MSDFGQQPTEVLRNCTTIARWHRRIWWGGGALAMSGLAAALIFGSDPVAASICAVSALIVVRAPERIELLTELIQDWRAELERRSDPNSKREEGEQA